MGNLVFFLLSFSFASKQSKISNVEAIAEQQPKGEEKQLTDADDIELESTLQ
jgi:hypothetical protein